MMLEFGVLPKITIHMNIQLARGRKVGVNKGRTPEMAIQIF